MISLSSHRGFYDVQAKATLQPERPALFLGSPPACGSAKIDHKRCLKGASELCLFFVQALLADPVLISWFYTVEAVLLSVNH